MPLANVPYAREGLLLAIAVALFLVSGADTVIAFLEKEVAQEVLGVVATLLAVGLGVMVRPKRTPPAPSGNIHPPHQ
jgi:hypothetical protein